MDIRKLQIFQAVAQHQSFTRAAGALCMTQPAVSKAISELESEAGTPLFERDSKRTVLTPAGRALQKRSGSVLDLYHALEQELTQLDGQAPLHIGSCITVANDLLPRLLRRQAERFPAATVQVDIASAAVILDRLDNNDLDGAFIEGPVIAEWADVTPVSAYTIHAVCAPEFAQAHPVHTARELIGLPLLVREKGSAIRDKLDSFFQLQDLCIAPRWTSTNSNALLQAALQGFGVAFLPANMVQKKLADQRLTEITVPGLPLQNNCYFVHKKQKDLNEPLLYLLQTARQWGGTAAAI